MAEWSKAVDLRSIIVRCVGSNPTLCRMYGLYRLCRKINRFWLCLLVPVQNNIHFYITAKIIIKIKRLLTAIKAFKA